jgi:hypothetical protein
MVPNAAHGMIANPTESWMYCCAWGPCIPCTARSYDLPEVPVATHLDPPAESVGLHAPLTTQCENRPRKIWDGSYKQMQRDSC